MKNKVLLLLLLLFVGCARESNTVNDLAQHFLDPPQESRPMVWWHWMDGNITKDGIRKDLEWMKRSGLRGFHHFDAALTTPQVVEERLVYMQPEWKDAFRYALDVADSLGLEVTIASSPGWSHTGGPWVEPQDAMKKLVWTERVMGGGRHLDVELERPFTDTGLYLNANSGSMNIDMGGKPLPQHYEDIAVVAVRISDEEEELSASARTVRSSGTTENRALLSDNDLISGVKVPYKDGVAYLEYEFQEPVRVSSLVFGGGSMTATTTLLVDGKPVAEIPTSGIAEQSITFAPVTGKRFRIQVQHWPANPLYSLLGLSWDSSTVNITEFRLYSIPRIHLAEAKAGFSASEGLGRMLTPDIPAPYAGAAIDLTSRYQNGKLRWDAPEGRWKIYRFGWSLTGKENHPAPPEATGLEVDKLDPVAWRKYFVQYLDMYKAAAGGSLEKIQYLLNDSYESGCETWTPAMADEFARRRGYELIPWLPVLTGEIIGSVEESERFLSDWRRTLGELVAENFDQLSLILQEYGLKGRYTESHEGSYALIADGMDIKRTAEVPMAAIWATGAYSSTAEPTGIADIRESASVSHIYGQKYVAAESMTAVGIHNQAYAFWPGNLKRLADLEFSAGVNRIIIHESAHQPLDDKFPGLCLSVTGQWFNRHETWAEYARPWTDYLARTSYLLQQGVNIADILLYYGDDTCVVVRYGDAEPSLPKGYNYDFVNSTALREEIAYSDGVFTARKTGARWNTLVIDADIIPDDVKTVLDAWKSAGARIMDIKSISMDGIEPDVRTESDLRFVHRHISDGEIYWVSSPKGGLASMSFHAKGRNVTVWDPETGEIRHMVAHADRERTVVELTMNPDDARFIVFSDRMPVRTDNDLEGRNVDPAIVRESILPGPWTVTFQHGRGAPESASFETLCSYTEADDPGIKFFSGTAIYHKTFTLEEVPGRAVLDLGKVYNMAEVVINGQNIRTLWKEPYRVNIGKALKSGTNTMEIRVTNLWPNRLIRDAQLPEEERITYTAYPFYQGDEPLLEGGLVGPVKLLFAE